MTALVSGQVDAVIIDQPVAADAVGKQGGVEIAAEIPTNELYGFPTAPDNPLIDSVNEAIGELIDDGTMNELYQQYFSTDAPASVTEGK